MSDVDLPGFTAEETRTLVALIDTAIPPDESPGGWAGGVSALLENHLDGMMSWCREPLRRAIRRADELAREDHGLRLEQLTKPEREEIFRRVDEADSHPASDDDGGVTLGSAPTSSPPLGTLSTVAFQGYYGGTCEPAGWRVAGFRPLPLAVDAVEPAPLPTVAIGEMAQDYDVIVVGAGAGGGVVAAELAEAGHHVLLVERSRQHTSRELRDNHLQGKRSAVYDVVAGPAEGNPRVLEKPNGSTVILPGEANGFDYGLVAMTVGGGTRVWQGMSWRFFPEDFRMATEYGIPDGSTLADWPFGYDELAPYYDRVEWELGVSGDGSGDLRVRTPRSRAYPMPPMPDDVTRRRLADSAHRLGWSTTSIPFAINTVARSGRAACVRCSQCVGHSCPVDAKNGTHNTFIPRALASGNADLLVASQVVEVQHDGAGVASGVRVLTASDDGPVESVVRARQVVIAAGAIETPRLILASGLGNEWVGRNHHSHGVAIATAMCSPPGVKTYVGPGHSVATLQFVHREKTAWGGGVLFDTAPDYPLERAMAGAGISGHRFGIGHKRWMREAGPSLGAASLVQEIPHHDTVVRLDPVVRDRLGMPAIRVRGVAHPATVDAVAYMTARATEWVEASGGRDVRATGIAITPQGTEHSAGTVRMGSNPAASACDSTGLLFGTTNVFVADASLHPTNGGFNPALTVMANAMRVAKYVVAMAG